ncbi:MAG: carboxypeptidase-like regulatory domain-containing protein [Thermoguttaceae bacterium]
MRRVLCVLMCVGMVLGFVVCGCGESNPRAAGLVNAAGKVTLNGQPLGGAAITFHNESDPTKQGGAAISKDDGSFVLNMFSEGDGTYPGDYVVTATKISITYPVSNEEMMRIERENPDKLPAGKETNLVPAKYAAKASSDARVNVPANGSKSLLIELKD